MATTDRALTDPNYIGPNNSYGVNATVKGNNLNLHQAGMVGDAPGGSPGTDFTSNKAVRYAPIATNYGANPYNGGVGTDIGSTGYMSDVYKHRLYETGGHTSYVDPTSQYIGGNESWAPDFYDQQQRNALYWGSRNAPAMQTYSVDPNAYNPDMGGYNLLMGAQGQARDYSAGGLNQMATDLGGIRALASGQGQSAAQMAMQRQSEQQMAQQMAMAASARGAGANAAHLAAVNNNAVAGGQLVRDLGIQRAEEQQAWADMLMRGTDSYLGQVGAVRGQDLSGAQLSGQMALDQSAQLYGNQMGAAQLLADQENARMGYTMDNQGQNDEMVRYFMGLGYDAVTAQQQARMAYEGMRTGNVLENARIEAGIPKQQSFGERLGEAATIGLIETGANTLGSWFSNPATARK